MNKTLESLSDKISRFEKQKKIWMLLSILMVLIIILYAVSWSFIESLNNIPLDIAYGTFFLCITASWWYWTMSLVANLLKSKQEEYKILQVILEEVVEVKKDISQLRNYQ